MEMPQLNRKYPV